MKYLYGTIFILLLGFGIASIEQHLLVTNETGENDREPGTISSSYEDEAHGVPLEFADNINQKTSDEIKQPYLEKFERLQSDTMKEVANLINLVHNDYLARKESEEPISYLYFYRTYFPKLKQLENQTEASFKEKYEQLEQELAEHGYSKEYALPFKQQFEQTKQDQLKQLMALISP